MKAAKLGAVFLVAVMALAGIGAAYAHWEETLTITGVMKTDDIDPGFYCADSNDEYDDQSMDPIDCGTWSSAQWSGCRRDKNVGWCDIDTSNDYKTLNIRIGDAYPCYYAHPYWCIKNQGSCPVLIHSVKLTELSFNWYDEENEEQIGVVWDNLDINLDDTKYYFVDIYFDGQVWQADVDVYENGDLRPEYDFSFHPTGEWDINTQVDPVIWDKEGTVEDHMEDGYEAYEDELEQDLCIHFENGCREKAAYDFEIEMVYYNWPEYVTPE